MSNDNPFIHRTYFGKKVLYELSFCRASFTLI